MRLYLLPLTVALTGCGGCGDKAEATLPPVPEPTSAAAPVSSAGSPLKDKIKDIKVDQDRLDRLQQQKSREHK